MAPMGAASALAKPHCWLAQSESAPNIVPPRHDAGLETMTIVMYERVGFEGRRPSPFSWRIRYALTHKGVDIEYRPVRFADVDTIKRLSGQHFVPIIVMAQRSCTIPGRSPATSRTAFPTSRPCLATR